MKPFRFDDAHVFKGRKKEIYEVTQQLEGLSSSGVSLLLISGASGVGKTSLVFGGLLPTLCEMDRGLYWVGISPRDQTGGFFHSLAVGLSRCDLFASPLSSEKAIDHFAATLRNQCQEATSQISALLAQDRRNVCVDGISEVPQSNLVIVVDSLEQIAEQGESEVDAVLHCMNYLAKNHRISVVGAMRTPFFSRCEQLIKHQGHFYELRDVSPEGLEEIVDGAVSAVEHEIAPGGDHPEIRGDIYNQIFEVPSTLPFLAPAMGELSRECQTSHRLTIAEGYEKLGGIAGVMGRVAEQVFSSLRPSVQSGLNAVMQKLVDVSGESGIPMPNEGVLRKHVVRTSDGKTLTEVLTDHCLLRITGVTRESAIVELAHPDLTTRWQRLQDWAAREHYKRSLCCRLSSEADRWRKERRQPEYLVKDLNTLADAKDLMDEGYGHLDQLTIDYISESLLRVENAEEKEKAGHGLGFSVLLLGFAIAMGYGAFRHFHEAISRPKPKHTEALQPIPEPSRPLMEMVRPAVHIPDSSLPEDSESEVNIAEKDYPAVDDGEILKALPVEVRPTSGRMPPLPEPETNELKRRLKQMIASFNEDEGEASSYDENQERALQAFGENLQIYSARLDKDANDRVALKGKIRTLEKISAVYLISGDIPKIVTCLEESFKMRTDLSQDVRFDAMRAELNKDAPDLIFQMGIILKAYDDVPGYRYARGRKFGWALHQDDPLPVLNGLLARLLFFSGQYDAALASWGNADAVTEGLEPEIEIGRILALCRLGDKNAAVKAYSNLILYDSKYQRFSTVNSLAWPEAERGLLQKVRSLVVKRDRSLENSLYTD